MILEKIYKFYLSSGTIITDSRKINPGSVFFGIGKKNGEGIHNGSHFAKEALESGASCVVVNHPEWRGKWSEEEPVFYVEDAEQALQDLAVFHRKQLRIPIIAIAGSNGKTTTKELIQAVLSQKMSCYATEGNLNNHLGLPLSILRIRPTHEIAILEIGANHLGETKFLCELLRPDFGLLTNTGKDHMGEYGSFENIIKANKELYDWFEKEGGKVFVNHRDDLLVECAQQVRDKYFYGEKGDTVAVNVIQEPILEVELIIEEQKEQIKTSLFGAFWKDSLCAAACIGNYFGVSNQQIASALSHYKPQSLRSQWIGWKGNQVLLDCYNANPSSMASLIDAVQSSKPEPKLLVLGEMLELGEFSKSEHIEILEKIDFEKVQNLFLYGEEFRVLEFAHPKAKWFQDKNILKEAIEKWAEQNQGYIYVKGSRSNRLETIFELI